LTYFADLTPFVYGRGSDIDELNVGWLSDKHEFTRGVAPAGFVEALLICAKRPIREARGHHTCDMCNEQRWIAMQLDGREIKLGTGQIRVQAIDGCWYTAPTLVAHYVDAHEYLPPAPFIDAVLRHVEVLRERRAQRPRVLTKRIRWRQ
jgi:hypothetical protein